MKFHRQLQLTVMLIVSLKRSPYIDKFEIKGKGLGGRSSSLHIKKPEFQSPPPFSHAFQRKKIEPSEFKRLLTFTDFYKPIFFLQIL